LKYLQEIDSPIKFVISI